MKIIKISGCGGFHPHEFKHSLIYKLMERAIRCEIKFTNIFNADLIFIGPYYSFSNIVSNKIFRRIFSQKNYIPHISIFLRDFFFKKNKTYKKIYHSAESDVKYENIKADYYLTCFLSNKKNHFRIPYWKRCAEWPEYDIYHDKTVPGNVLRYGESFEIKKMMEPLGKNFINRERKLCIFSSHMDYPRNEIYTTFKKEFSIDGYGSYFDKTIINHNKSSLEKKTILKNYAFNLCPENSCLPGMVGQNVADSFLAGSLAVTWTNRYINREFNKNAFVNLIDHENDNYSEIIDLLKDDNYLEKFSKEPLLLKKPDLENEISFFKELLSSI